MDQGSIINIYMKEYVAGFLDADGSVALSSKTGKHEWQRRPEVSLYNADVKLLQAIQKAHGGKIREQTYDNPNWNTSYQLNFNCNESLDLLEEVVPCMLHSKKKKRAELIVKYYKQYTPRNGKYTQELIKKKISFNEQVMGIQMRGAGAY